MLEKEHKTFQFEKPFSPDTQNYSEQNHLQVRDLLVEGGAFEFDSFTNGLFPAVGKGSATEQTSGYRAVWVRDNVHIAYGHLRGNKPEAAVKNALSLASFFETQRARFEHIISKPKASANPMNRPHIRFDGETGKEIAERWPHAQNDALGAFIWFFCTLMLEGRISMTDDRKQLLHRFIRYFEAIAFWRDEDSGHWEETRKISASSIGAVTAGLRKLTALNIWEEAERRALEALIQKGAEALQKILPAECIQPDPLKNRRYDAALLFLVDPYDVVDTHTADKILNDVQEHLKGDLGISRYPMDSYWGPDYRTIPPEKRTIDLSNDIISRDDYAKTGLEAKWCIFDSVISVIYGKRFQATADETFLTRQKQHWQRALSQIVRDPNTGRLLLPEAYFVENQAYVPNDHMPLQWAHANLLRAFFAMSGSLQKK